MHDLGFGSEHIQSKHDSHEEHNGLGETLEIFFTVLGGLILLGAHFFNIRLANKTS